MSYFALADPHSPRRGGSDGILGDGRASPGRYSAFHATPAPTRPTDPLFDLKCPGGCDPVLLSPIACHAALRQAILDACQFALNAARKLEAPRRDVRTIDEFRRLFNHDPGLLLPWPGIRDSGTRFARRFRAVADALRRSRTQYRCDPCTTIREDPPPGAILDAHAIAIPLNEVVLCPSFWRLPRFLQAGVIIHEMFHLRFDPCFRHGGCETKRTNAYCYEAFALRMAGHEPEPIVIQNCDASPP
jgi:hypothetical protein